MIQELLCGEATAVPDMKNSPATIRFFFSDAEWKSPSSAGGVGCDTERVSGRVPQLPVFVRPKPVKTTVCLNKKASVRESLCIKCEPAERSRHPDGTPAGWLQSAAPTPLHHPRSCIRVGHLGSCSCILTQRGFVQGAGAALWTFGTDVKICHTEEGGPASGDNVFTSSTMNSFSLPKPHFNFAQEIHNMQDRNKLFSLFLFFCFQPNFKMACTNCILNSINKTL